MPSWDNMTLVHPAALRLAEGEENVLSGSARHRKNGTWDTGTQEHVVCLDSLTTLVADEQVLTQPQTKAPAKGKPQYFDKLDVRGKLAAENGEKGDYAKCQIGEQRLSQTQTSP